jgi:hypothetical protein
MELADRVRIEAAILYRTRAWQTVEVDLGPHLRFGGRSWRHWRINLGFRLATRGRSRAFFERRSSASGQYVHINGDARTENRRG